MAKSCARQKGVRVRISARNIRILSGSAGIILLYITGRFFLGWLFAVGHFSFSFDHQISSSAKQSVVEFVAGDTSLKKKSGLHLCSLLKKQFSPLKDVAIVYLPTGKACINASVYTPKYCINHEYILCENDHFYQRSFFDDNIVNLLPCLTVQFDGLATSDFSLPAKLCAWLSQVPHELFKSFHVSWHDEQRILLRDKGSNGFVLICSADVVPNDSIMKASSEIKHRLISQGALNASGKQCWYADARFKDQIILAKKNLRG